MNKIILSAFISFAISQFIKILILSANNQKDVIKKIYKGYGGMPSSHAAVASSIVFSVYFIEGMSNLFFVSLVFALIIMVDVLNLRERYEKRDKILNQLIKKQNSKKGKINLIYEKVGHELKEVIVGILIAFIVSLFLFK